MNDELLAIAWDEFLEPAWKPVEAGEMERGTPVMLYEWTRGTKESMQHDANNLRNAAGKYVQRHLPLECWVFSIKGTGDTYEFWAEYHGTQTSKTWATRWRKYHSPRHSQE